jgi:hypothetical protein
MPSTVSVTGKRGGPVGPQSKARLGWIVGIAVGLLAAGLVGSLKYKRHSAEPQPTATLAEPTGSQMASNVVAATPAPSSAGPRMVHVTIEATPAGARLYLDDVLLSGNPFEGDLPSDPGQHSLRAESPGFAPQTRTVALTGPMHIGMRLERVAESGPGKRAAGGRGAPPGPASATGAPTSQPAPAAACNPPFYFDADGIKHLKMECLK